MAVQAGTTGQSATASRDWYSCSPDEVTAAFDVDAAVGLTAARAAELGLVTRVVPDRDLLATATTTAQKLAAKPSAALRAAKRLIKRAAIDQLRAAVKIENQEYVERLRSAEAKEAFSAFLEKRPPNFAKTVTPVAAE